VEYQHVGEDETRNFDGLDWKAFVWVGQAHRSSGPSSRARVIDVSQSIESIPNDAMKLDHSNPISSLHELALLAATQKRASRPYHPTNPVPVSNNYGKPMTTDGIPLTDSSVRAKEQH